MIRLSAAEAALLRDLLLDEVTMLRSIERLGPERFGALAKRLNDAAAPHDDRQLGKAGGA